MYSFVSHFLQKMQLLIVLVLYAASIAQSLSVQTGIETAKAKQPDPPNKSIELAARFYVPEPKSSSDSSEDDSSENPNYDVNPLENDYNQLQHHPRKPALFNNKSLSYSLSRQLFGCRYISEIVNIDQFSSWKVGLTIYDLHLEQSTQKCRVK